jgi:hypothetical protein
MAGDHGPAAGTGRCRAGTVRRRSVTGGGGRTCDVGWLRPDPGTYAERELRGVRGRAADLGDRPHHDPAHQALGYHTPAEYLETVGVEA